jgi:hypothetical protein
MQFYTDHYFQIGSAHYQAGKPCQDYALSGGNEKKVWAVVSDGCSTGRHTDIGSRLQTLSLMSVMRSELSPESVSQERKKFLNEALQTLGLSRQDMLATSVYVYLDEGGGYVHVEGDGAVAKKYKSGKVSLALYEWQDNTPFYPLYNDTDREAFIALHGGDIDLPRLTRTEVVIEPDGTRSEISQSFSIRQGLSGIVERILPLELEELEFVAVFTDGVGQIKDVDWTEVMIEFMAFKNFEGEFVKRRMIRALKVYEKEGKKHFDDIATAVIRIHNEEEVEDAILQTECSTQS